MKKTLTLITLSSLIAVSSNSCKKKIYGCTDQSALNSSSIANTDDGSCFYKTNNVNVEYFSLDFSSTGSYKIYTPTTPIQEGDVIIVETYSYNDNGTQFWSPLPYVSSNLSLYYEYVHSTGQMWVNTIKVNDGSPYPFANPVNFSFRLAVIKWDGITPISNYKNIKINDLIK